MRLLLIARHLVLLLTALMAENKRKLGVDSASESEELSSHDEDDIFEVERILAEDVVEDQTFYLVKWVNYVGTKLDTSS